MRECTVFVINKTTGDLVDEFVTDYVNDKQLEDFMSDEIHNYDISYNNLLYFLIKNSYKNAYENLI